MTQVSFINGRTRMYAIVGDPIPQVRSPEAVSWEFQQRGMNAVLFPAHIPADKFDTIFPALMQLGNLDGIVVTIPFKKEAMRYAQHIGAQARIMGAGNVMARRQDGTWAADMLDGAGCVAAFLNKGYAIKGKRLMLMGLGGAGGSVGAAMAAQEPALMRIFDLDEKRCEIMARAIKELSPNTRVEISPPNIEGIDILLNATPVGMLADPRLPLEVSSLPPELIVFDAIVVPDETRLLKLAQDCGCRIVKGHEMMMQQVPKIVEFFIAQKAL